MTINEIAKACGVSSATVSRALSGNAYVKPETYKRIMECAEALGYEYSSQKNKQNLKIMLIVGDISNYFYIGIIKGIGSLLNSKGYKVAIFNSNYDHAQEEEYVRFAYSDNFSGIIMITAMETVALIKLLKKNTCPVVLVNRYIRSMDLNAVCIDNHRGGYLATTYLIDKGHKKIAHLAGPRNSTASQDRLIGFQHAMNDSELSVAKDAIYYGDLMRDSGCRFAEYYLKKLRDYTAVFFANDISAVGFLECVLQHGIRVPDDLSIICFDDATATIGGAIKLTTVSRDPNSMGIAAAELMVDTLANKDSQPRKLVFPPVLNERDSVKTIIQPVPKDK